MLLFVNVCITPDKACFNIEYSRGLYPLENKLDILMYTLASYATAPWSHVVCNVLLAKEYKDREEELHTFIKDIFKNHKLILNNSRVCLQKDWQRQIHQLLELNDPLTFCVSNHDHPFMDYNLDVLKLGEEKILEDSHTHAVLRYSHLSEFPNYWTAMKCDIDEDGFKTLRDYMMGIDAVKTKTLLDWWYSFDIGDTFCPRPDWQGLPKGAEMKVYYPPRTLCDHFDAYMHAEIPISVVPPLKIPQGFFDKDIKILYGGHEPKEGYFYINPTVKRHSCIDPYGTDAYWVLDDIPLFWRSRISKYAFASDVNSEKFLEARNLAILRYLFPFKERKNKHHNQSLLIASRFALRQGNENGTNS